ncbi:hypothetical protein AB0B28_13110 [Glycomyces sp. NPDC046736]|uniref:hypothetical protein n=1 Tax=Glycomyces sp. NPDC046736 TaxID=3155615 RepID=UPI0034103D32
MTRLRSTQWTRAAGALALASALALAGCGDSPEGEEAEKNRPPGEGTQTDLLALLNESDRLLSELVTAENRILEQCLEDEGFTVHDKFTILDSGAGLELESLASGDAPAMDLFPDPDMAAKWGFGEWANTDEGMAAPDYDEYMDLRHADRSDSETDAAELGFDGEQGSIDNSAFEALSEDDKLAWYVAYGGTGFAAWQGLTDEEWEDWREESGGATTPKPDGCLLEMTEGLYGEPELVVDEEEGTAAWSGRPDSPEFAGSGWEDILPTYRERIAAEESAFLDCLIDRDRGAWEYDEFGTVYYTGYFIGVYTGQWESTDGSSYSEGVPTPPSDLPADFEGLRRHETEVAVDFVECGAESGLSEAAPAAWEAVHLEFYQSIEPELFTWQDELKAALDKSQELIGA